MSTIKNRMLRIMDAYPEKWLSPMKMQFYIGGKVDTIRTVLDAMYRKGLLVREKKYNDFTSNPCYHFRLKRE